MPAPYWGYLSPEREELQNELLRAQQVQAQKQATLSEMLTAQAEDDSLQWEQLELQKEQLKKQTELTKAQQLLLEDRFQWEQEEAETQRGFEAEQAEQEQLSTLLGQQIEQQTEMEKLYAPEFVQIVNTLYFTDPKTGEATPVARAPEGIILKEKERLVEKSTGEVLTQSEEVIQTDYHIIGVRGGVPFSYAPIVPLPEGTIGEYTPEGAINIFDEETGEFVETVLTAEPPRATMAEMITAEAAGVTAEATALAVEYDYIVEMAKIEAAKDIKWAELGSTERIEAAKRVGENLDRALDEDRITIEAGQLVLNRDMMLQEAKTEKERQDLDKYLGELKAKTEENVEQLKVALGYAGLDTKVFLQKIENASKEKVEWWKIKSTEDIATLDRALEYNTLEFKKGELKITDGTVRWLELNKNEQAQLERDLKAELAADKDILTRLEIAVGMKAVEVTELGIRLTDETARIMELGKDRRAEFDRELQLQMTELQVTLGYAGLSSGEFMKKLQIASDENIAWWEITSREDMSNLDRMVAMRGIEVKENEIRITDETARFLELGRNERSGLDRELTLQGLQMQTRLGYAGLDMNETIAKMEFEGKRAEETAKVTREETEHLMALMGRATGQIRSMYGMYKPEDRAEAAKALITLIEVDMSISPETKARWLAVAPALQGVTMTLAEGIDEDLRPEYEDIRIMWEEALDKATTEAGLPPPAKTYKGVSIEELINEVDKIYADTGSQRKVEAYLKKYGLTLEEYREEARRIYSPLE